MAVALAQRAVDCVHKMIGKSKTEISAQYRDLILTPTNQITSQWRRLAGVTLLVSDVIFNFIKD